jgi:hypothetical protein
MSCCHKPLAIYRSCGNDLYERATAMKKRSVSALIDDEQPDSAEEAEMSEAAFAIIERAHELCGYPPARELSADLGNSELSNTKHVSLLPPQREEQALTEGEGCLVVHATKILRSRQLLAEWCEAADELSQMGHSVRERAHAEIIAHHFKGRAATSTLEALAFQLRAGVGVLKERDARRRLSELSDQQLIEICARVQRHKPEIAPVWSDDDVNTLMQLRVALR